MLSSRTTKNNNNIRELGTYSRIGVTCLYIHCNVLRYYNIILYQYAAPVVEIRRDGNTCE